LLSEWVRCHLLTYRFNRHTLNVLIYSGINKPDVRYVIHFSIPKSLTNYYQESGRAGRDGGLSESIVFYSYADKQRLSSLAQKGNEGGGGNWHKADAVKRALDNIAEVTSYCMNRLDCRRSMVLKYFGYVVKLKCCYI
jgi:bloom syndrome protein